MIETDAECPFRAGACRHDIWYCCSHLVVIRKARKEGDLFYFLVREREEALRGAYSIIDILLKRKSFDTFRYNEIFKF